MSELSDEASESEQLGSSLSLWLGGTGGQLVRPEELDVPLDLHTACSIGQYDVVAECIRRWVHAPKDICLCSKRYSPFKYWNNKANSFVFAI